MLNRCNGAKNLDQRGLVGLRVPMTAPTQFKRTGMQKVIGCVCGAKHTARRELISAGELHRMG